MDHDICGGEEQDRESVSGSLQVSLRQMGLPDGRGEMIGGDRSDHEQDHLVEDEQVENDRDKEKGRKEIGRDRDQPVPRA